MEGSYVFQLRMYSDIKKEGGREGGGIVEGGGVRRVMEGQEKR